MKHSPEYLVDYLLTKEPYLITRLTEIFNYTEIESKQGLTECIRYLCLVSNYKEKLTPSIAIDEIWHELILFTRLYFDLCERYLDRYIHHNPGGKQHENQVQYSRTTELYQRHYGQLDKQFWSLENSKKAEVNCGACEGQ